MSRKNNLRLVSPSQQKAKHKPNGKVDIDPNSFRETPESCFYAKLGENCFLESGIYKDDYLLISTIEAVESGDFVAITDANGKTVVGIAKFISKENLRLEYTNSNFPSVDYKLSQIKIIGKAVRMERDFYIIRRENAK